MRFVLNVDGETPQNGLFYVTVHREKCPHAVRNDVRRDRRYWVRGPLRDLDAVRKHVEDQIEHIQARYGKKLRRKDCASCKPGEER